MSGRMKRIAAGALLTVLLAPAVLLLILATETGTGWAIQLIPRLVDEKALSVRLAGYRGSLLGNLALQGLSLEMPGIEIDADQLSITWSPTALLRGTLNIKDIAGTGLTVLSSAQSSDASATTPLVLPELNLPLAIVIDRLTMNDLRVRSGDTKQLIEHVGLSAALDDQILTVENLSLRVADIEVAGNLDWVTVAPHGIAATLRLNRGESLLGDGVGPVGLLAEVSGQTLTPHIALAASAPITATLTADLDLTGAEPIFAAVADWQPFDADPFGAAGMSVSAGQLSLNGRVKDYQVRLDTAVAYRERSPIAVSLVASGDSEQARLAPLTLAPPRGNVAVEGVVSWSSALQWNLGFRAAHIDPSDFVQQWPGDLAASMRFSGNLMEGAPATLLPVVAELRVDSIVGALRDQPLEVSGVLNTNGDALTVQDLSVLSGPNAMSLRGQVGRALDLEAEIAVVDLGASLPQAAGDATGKARILGEWPRPGAKVDLTATRLAFADYSVESLDMAIDWNGEDGDATLTVGNARSPLINVPAADMRLSGSLQNHQLDASLAVDERHIELATKGGLAGDRWRGDVNRLVVGDPLLGTWQMDSPFAIDASRQQVTAERMCLNNVAASLCAEGTWAESAGMLLNAELAALDIDVVKPLLPMGTSVRGLLSASVSVQGDPLNPTAEVAATVESGTIEFPQDEEMQSVEFRDARFGGSVVNDTAKLRLAMDVQPAGEVSGDITIGPAKTDGRDMAGEVSAAFTDLSLVAGFVPSLDKVGGKLDVTGRVSGTTARPLVIGSLLVSDASALVVPTGVTLQDVSLTVESDPDGQLAIDGSFSAGDGSLQIAGNVAPRINAPPVIDVNVTGTNVQAVRLPDVSVVVSPSLKLAGQGPYHLSGSLEIPAARIALRSLPRSSVSVSDDERLVGANEPVVEKTTSQLTADVRVVLGEAVSFSGFGLDTALSGSLVALSNEAGPRVDGRIDLLNARYEAYGQDLSVERGRLLFAGPPDNPDLDMLAVRQSRDKTVNAYIQVNGPLAKPVSRVYSDPPLQSAEVLAYLLTGRGLENANQREGADITSAAISLGLAKSDPLLQKLGDRLGLDQLTLEAGDGGYEESALVVGKYLNPDLYLGYSQGLFSPEGTVLLRLRLSDTLELESRSGAEQSADLFYRVEYD
jgi:translocation and assembly module TamB